jgi:hypothetical protein
LTYGSAHLEDDVSALRGLRNARHFLTVLRSSHRTGNLETWEDLRGSSQV